VFLEEGEWYSDGQLSVSSVVHNPILAKRKRTTVNATVIFPPRYFFVLLMT
jgi:hypothetical protein